MIRIGELRWLAAQDRPVWERAHNDPEVKQMLLDGIIERRGEGYMIAAKGLRLARMPSCPHCGAILMQ